MKLILAVVDEARAGELGRALIELGAPGYTELPVLEGAGRTGIHSGDRIHPGGLVAFLTVVDDARATPLFDELLRRRDAACANVCRFFMLPVERQG